MKQRQRKILSILCFHRETKHPKSFTNLSDTQNQRSPLNIKATSIFEVSDIDKQTVSPIVKH